MALTDNTINKKKAINTGMTNHTKMQRYLRLKALHDQMTREEVNHIMSPSNPVKIFYNKIGKEIVEILTEDFEPQLMYEEIIHFEQIFKTDN